MTGEQLVFSDDRGNYYVLSRETLERAIVTGEQRAKIEQALTGNEVSGFAFQILNPNQTFPDIRDSLLDPPFKLTGILRPDKGRP
jgi:hypothetical protein